ncbi:MAG: HAD-IIB family hydrolase [Candidatus Paceibacterota bacterium]|jgi:HAD superfamily hydrolase (TIGR01484 family)
MKYLFLDLDGTISKSRQKAEINMLRELQRISKKYKIFIVSGAEYSRMLLQAPVKNVVYMAQNANDVRKNGKVLWTNQLSNKKDILEHIKLIAKKFGFKLGEDNIEDRGSQIVVSFTGFRAPQELKNKFDPDRKIRMEMLRKFPHPNAYVAGLTGIDFIPKTKGENIQKYLKLMKIKSSDCLYIGDALEKGANDESVCGIIPTFAVKNPKDTLQFIKQI